MQGINFITIDFETATGKRASICEAGICIMRNGEVAETRSWLVRPQRNSYSYWNMKYTVSDRMTRLIPRNFRKYGRKSANTLKTFLCLWFTMPLLTSVASATRWSSTAWRGLTLLIIVPSARHAGSITSAATLWTTFATTSR